MKTVPRDKRRNCAMEKLFAGYVNARLDSYLEMLENENIQKVNGFGK